MGLALSGGGSTGAYEVGVIKFLKEKNIEFDVVTGTSIGALNGAFVATNRIEELENLWLSITPEKISKNGLEVSKTDGFEFRDGDFSSFLRSYVGNKGADITPFKELCKKYINPLEIQKSHVKFGIVCARFPSLDEQRKEMHSVDVDLVLPFLHASSACFPVFPVETVNGEKYIDGFYRNNLPIDYCFDLGADNVIAVDLVMFGIKPQNHYLTSLYNVRCIKPRIGLGSFLDFTQSAIRSNIQRGYLDAKKSFGELVGGTFAFSKDDDLTMFGNNFIKELSNEFGSFNNSLLEFLINRASEKNTPITNEYSLLLVALECFGDVLQIDDTICYSHHAFFKKINDSISAQEKPFFVSKLELSKNRIVEFYNSRIAKKTAADSSKMTSSDKLLQLYPILSRIYKNDSQHTETVLSNAANDIR